MPRTNGNGRNGRAQKPYVYKAWPAWYYGPDGQSAMFNGPLEVPDGWHDSPDKVGNPKATTTIPGYEEALAAAEGRDSEDIESDSEDSDIPLYDDITATQIKERLDQLGVPYQHNDSKSDLYRALVAAVGTDPNKED